MNLQALSAEIVARVQHSPDSAHNLALVVANLIEQEMERDNQHHTFSEWSGDQEAKLMRDYVKDFGPK